MHKVKQGLLLSTSNSNKIYSVSQRDEMLKVITGMLDSLFIDCPKLETLNRITHQWLDIINPIIPQTQWHRCYLSAMQKHKTTFPLAPGNLIEEWKLLQQQIKAERNTKSKCKGCEIHGENCPIHR